jgi:hypothetical protein
MNARDEQAILTAKVNANNEACQMVKDLVLFWRVPAEEIKEAIEDVKRAAVNAATIYLSQREGEELTDE